MPCICCACGIHLSAASSFSVCCEITSFAGRVWAYGSIGLVFLGFELEATTVEKIPSAVQYNQSHSIDLLLPTNITEELLLPESTFCPSFQNKQPPTHNALTMTSNRPPTVKAAILHKFLTILPHPCIRVSAAVRAPRENGSDKHSAIVLEEDIHVSRSGNTHPPGFPE